MQTLTRPKFEVMGRLMDCRCKARCVEVDCKRLRRMLMKMRGGTAELRLLLYCTVMVYGRGEKGMVRLVTDIMEGWQEMESKDKVVCVW